MQPAKTSLDQTGQTAQASQAYVLELNTLGELFDAPHPDPFKTRMMDVLGIAGIDELQKRVQRTWPRAPGFDRIVLALPANQNSPDAAAQAQTAIDRYCDAQLEKNKLLYRQSIRVSKRQLAISLIILAFDLVLLWWISTLTITGLPAILLGIFAIVCVYAFALAVWDAVENLFFARGPFMQDNAVYKAIRAMRVSVVAR